MKKMLLIALIGAFTTVGFAQKAGKGEKTGEKKENAVKNNSEKKSPEENVNAKAEELKTELGLNDDQTTKLKAALTKRAQTMAANEKAIRDAEKNMKESRSEFNTEIEKLLTSDQLAKYKAAVEEKKASKQDSGKIKKEKNK